MKKSFFSKIIYTKITKNFNSIKKKKNVSPYHLYIIKCPTAARKQISTYQAADNNPDI